MNKNPNFISVIDAGTSKVTTLVAELLPDASFKLRGVGVAPMEGMKKGVIKGLDEVTHSIHRSVELAEKMANQVVVSAVVGISGDHIGTSEQRGLTTVSDPRGITREDMRRAVEASKCLLIPAGKQIVDIVEQDYIVDGHPGVKDPEGMAGNRLEVDVQLISGSTPAMQNLSKCVMKLNIEIERFILAPLASGDAVLKDDERAIGTVLMDFGAGTTDLAVFKNNVLKKARIFQVGSNHIDSDIAYGLSTTLSEAERLKKDFGLAYVDARFSTEPIEFDHVSQEKRTKNTRGFLCHVINARVCDLMRMIVRDLEMELSISDVPGGVVLTGGGGMLDGLQHVVEQELKTSVRIGRPIYDGELSEMVAGPEFATAVGLLKRAAHGAAAARNDTAARGTSLRGWISRFSNLLRGD